MSAETITFVNFLVHSLVIGATAWLLVRFVIRDALRRCILANLAVLMCLYSPFDISFRDLFPTTQHVPVLTPIRETLEQDWRVKVEPQKAIVPSTAAPTAAPSWDVNDLVKWLHRFSWVVTALLLMRLLVQSFRIQRWAWRLRYPSSAEYEKLPPDLNPDRLRVHDGECTPCAAGWFFPIIAVPASAFHDLSPQQWRWLLRHEMEHLRTNDTVAVLLQNIVLTFLWWNPFVHALIEEFARAREEACDAAAVGEEPDHTPYADFLLSWAAKPSPSRFAMTIARSRPARRLKDRLVALMEARGVRKKLGALFVLGCLAFAMITPFVAASFGIATAAAQEPLKADPQDDTMFTRLYIVAPDFVPANATARALLEKHGITFPEGSSAIYQAATSRLIVRHARTALDQIEAIIDRLHQRLPQVYFRCKLIQADTLIGKHESILKPEEAKELLAQVSQKKGIDLMSAPSVTTKMGQGATVEVVREIYPSKPWPKDAVPEIKFIGPSIKLVANPASEGKASIEAKVDLGIDPDAEQPWLPKKDAQPDWSRVQTFTVSSKAVLASGETLLLHLPTSKKPVTVLITAEALNPNGQRAINFESTATMQPSQTAMNVPDKAANEWAVRVYKLPKNFPQEKSPVEVLKAAEVPFPKGADASFKDGKLTVRNTKPNLELIDAWLDALIQAEEPKKHVHLNVKAVEMKGDLMKMMTEFLESSTTKVEAVEPSFNAQPATPAAPRQFTLAGVFTAPQLEILMKRLAAEAGVKIEVINPKQQSQMYDLPAALGGSEMKIDPVIGQDGYTIDMNIGTPPQNKNTANAITTSVTIWDGQTVVLGSQPSEGISRLLFITGNLVVPLAKK
ncbi:MAG: M56 family metallopeptidase [Verrucomicrobiaceae bacterium]